MTNTQVSALPFSKPRFSEAVLTGAAGFWLAAALIGQWAFFSYIAAFYGPNLVSGNFQAWAVLSKMGGTGYVAGDTAGNLTFGAHALAAGIIAFGGALQLMPWVRARFPAFHRWNGRVFLLTVTGLSLSGFYLVWVRHSSPGPISAISTTVNGLLILTFAALAWRTAVARNIAVHRRWAMRLYLVSNAQWFLRIGLFSYFIVNMAIGAKVKMSDPFLIFWTPGCYLVPLAVLELYLRAKDSGGPAARLAVAGGLIVAALLMVIGILAFSVFSLKIVTGAPLALPG
ncbi:hypothetical protein QO010_001188 [Caulobacter ginsengisoli]|uniref:DUF2306 domain-containing protein n=1 Tax=Caulobacter ginsengisoli TaxID=400775 RepID=A0ABU0IN37_9CAUL|nr:DUF2306 domain-containing protein [Caulobacter ginsengisoli]MDQ0463417.1 hypothetical protein [Caulobacter ginsengisoli]